MVEQNALFIFLLIEFVCVLAVFCTEHQNLVFQMRKEFEETIRLCETLAAEKVIFDGALGSAYNSFIRSASLLRV